MSEIDKQQENIPTPQEQTSPTEGLEDNAGETPTPSVEGGNGGNSSQEIDWELQVAQAYQQAEASSTKAEAKTVPQEENVRAEAQEVANLKEAKESLQAQMEAMQAQFEDVSSQYKRLAADFDNYRKRTQKEKEELDLHVKCTTITKLLPIVDNFERARSQIKPQNEGEMNIHKSYQSVYKQMVDGLKQLGVSPMRPEGQEFDPNFHEAVMREATTEYPEGTVTEELVRGYVLGDRILRHAMVKVAAAPEEPMATEESPPEIQEEPS
jgi:molecular chaperone GrpE